MSVPGAILTLGLGTFTDVNHIVTLGYETSATPTPTPTPTISSIPADMSGGGAQGGWHSSAMSKKKRRKARDDRDHRQIVQILKAIDRSKH